MYVYSPFSDTEKRNVHVFEFHEYPSTLGFSLTRAFTVSTARQTSSLSHSLMAFTPFHIFLKSQVVLHAFSDLHKLPNSGNLEHAIAFTSAVRVTPSLELSRLCSEHDSNLRSRAQ
jgi:hypothetical protein